MPETTHEGNDPMGALTTHRGPLETCPAPECQDRIIEQQEDTEPGTQPTATVAGQSIALNVTGYPDVPNRWGTGSIRVTGLRLDYGNTRTPDGRHAFITGLWVNDDGQVTDDPLDRYYDAPDGDTSAWPDWIAELARQHTPTDRAAVLREAIDVAREEGHRLEAADGIDTARGARSVAYLLRKLLVKEQQPDTRVVAYRSPGTRTLYCVICARLETGWQPVTGAQVKDHTACDFCGASVLKVASRTLGEAVARYVQAAAASHTAEEA